MNKNECYILLYNDSHFSDHYQIVYLENKIQLHDWLIKLHAIKNKTNQPMTEFAYVFPKGSLYPADYVSFWKSRNDISRKHYSVNGSFFVQRQLKNGKLKQKFYDWAEDFDWQFDKWAGLEVVILDTNEALSADYVYAHDVTKYWGVKDELLA